MGRQACATRQRRPILGGLSILALGSTLGSALGSVLGCGDSRSPGPACPAGSIATAAGCAVVPVGQAFDAGGPRRGSGDAGSSNGGGRSDAALADAGIAWRNDAEPPDGPTSHDARALDPDGGRDAGSDRRDAAPTDIEHGRFDPTGQWALLVVTTDLVTSDLLGTQAVTVTTLSSVDLLQPGPSASFAPRVCDVTLTPFHGLRTTYPAAAINAIEVRPATAVLSQSALGASFAVDSSTSLLGWRATRDPANEPLPIDLNDARVYDADNDGNPGVTLLVAGQINGEIYVVNRSVLTLAGAVLTANRIEGTSHANRAQAVLQASAPVLASNVAIAPDPNGVQSFKMARLPHRGMSCPAIVAMRATLFP